MDDFFTTRDERNIARARALIEPLPTFVGEFFVGIAMRTSALTRMNYASDIRIFFDFLVEKKFKGRVSLDEITLKDINMLSAYDIEVYLEHLNSYIFLGKKSRCGAAAKERKLCSLRTFFKYFFKKEKLDSNVTANVDLPKVHNKPIVRLEVDEVVKVLDGVEHGEGLLFNKRKVSFMSKTKERDLAIITLLLGTGIRVSECVGLDAKDIDLENNSFTVTRKGGDKAILYFSDEVKEALQDYLFWLDEQYENKTNFAKAIVDHNALFKSSKGNRLSVRAIENIVKDYSKSAAPLKKISPHKLRSTYGTNLYRETQDIYVVADVLGHKDVNTTKKHYADMSDEIRRASSKKVVLRERNVVENVEND